jgi:membrane-associated protease RseP (regulator of RpoE activity)
MMCAFLLRPQSRGGVTSASVWLLCGLVCACGGAPVNARPTPAAPAGPLSRYAAPPSAKLQAAPDRSQDLSGLSFGDEPAKAGEVWLGSQLALQQRSAGVAVGSISPDSPAARAGLQPGDFIFQVDGASVDDAGDVLSKVVLAGPGGNLRLGVRRQGRVRLMRVELAARPELEGAPSAAAYDHAYESEEPAPEEAPATSLEAPLEEAPP